MIYSSTSSIGINPGKQNALATEIGRRIVSGRYASGALLPPEADLLTEFDVSRPSLREAIKLLESKGMLQARQRRGTVVTPRSHWNMLDAEVLGWIAQSNADPHFLIRLTELRLIVEPGACRLAARDASDDAILALGEALQRMVESVGNHAAYVQADYDFHLALMSAANNEYLAAVATAISAALTVSLQRMDARVRLEPTARNRASVKLHAPIVAAIAARDGEAAARASVAQLEDAIRKLHLLS